MEFHIDFDVRYSHDGNGNIELLIARKGAATHFKFPLKGLNAEQAFKTLLDFDQRNYFFIPDAIYYLAWACYRKQDENAENRNESYDKIMKNLEITFKDLLKWQRYKVIEESEVNGIKITKSAPIQSGRNKGTKKPRKLSEKEIENQKNRKHKILEAIREATNSESKSEIANIIGISRPTLRNWLKSVGVQSNRNFYDLIRFAESGK